MLSGFQGRTVAVRFRLCSLERKGAVPDGGSKLMALAVVKLAKRLSHFRYVLLRTIPQYPLLKSVSWVIVSKSAGVSASWVNPRKIVKSVLAFKMTESPGS